MGTNSPSDRGGFTLVELIVYAGIFAVSAVFLVNILMTVTRTQVRQSSTNEVNQQLSFVASTIQKLVRDSSLIDFDAGAATSTLILRMSSSSLDKTFVFASGTVLYLEQGSSTVGVMPAVPLTNDRVVVDNFSVTKYGSGGGLAVVQVDLTLSYNTTKPQAKVARSWRSAVTRVNAATFDSSLLPSAAGNYNVGASGQTWNQGFFSGDVTISGTGKLGVGTSPSSLATTKIKMTGDLGYTTSTYGLILMAPNSTCYRVTVNNAGTLVINSTTCP